MVDLCYFLYFGFTKQCKRWTFLFILFRVADVKFIEKCSHVPVEGIRMEVARITVVRHECISGINYEKDVLFRRIVNN